MAIFLDTLENKGCMCGSHIGALAALINQAPFHIFMRSKCDDLCERNPHRASGIHNAHFWACRSKVELDVAWWESAFFVALSVIKASSLYNQLCINNHDVTHGYTLSSLFLIDTIQVTKRNIIVCDALKSVNPTRKHNKMHAVRRASKWNWIKLWNWVARPALRARELIPNTRDDREKCSFWFSRARFIHSGFSFLVKATGNESQPSRRYH